MAFAPRSRMVPPPRSFAADAHDCIMVPIRLGSTEYKFVARSRRQWRAPLGSSSRMQTVTKSRLPPVDMWTIGFADRLRFPRFPSKLEKRGNARLRPHTHRRHLQPQLLAMIREIGCRSTTTSTSNRLTPKAPYKSGHDDCRGGNILANKAETTITLTDAPEDDESAVITDGLRAYNEKQAGSWDGRPLAIFARDPETQKVVGGLLGRTSLGLLRVDTFF